MGNYDLAKWWIIVAGVVLVLVGACWPSLPWPRSARRATTMRMALGSTHRMQPLTGSTGPVHKRSEVD